jgi:hypothetical protein
MQAGHSASNDEPLYLLSTGHVHRNDLDFVIFVCSC